MNEKAFYFSLDALITISIILLLFLMPTQKTTTAEKEIFTQQKMHDLLLVWAKERNFSEQEIKTDFEFVFGQKKGTIEFGNSIIESNPQKKFAGQKLTESINYVDKNSGFEKITLTVFD